SPYFSKPDIHPFDELEWEWRESKITNPDGSVICHFDQVEVPSSWSQLATDILVSKYLRRSGVRKSVGQPDHEVSAKQVVSRIAKAIRNYGASYFSSEQDAECFEREVLAL